MAKKTDGMKHLQTFLEITKNIAKEPEADSLYRTILNNAVGMTQAQGGTIYFYEEPTKELVFKYVLSPDPNVVKMLKGRRMKLGEGIVGKVARKLKTHLVAEAHKDAKFTSSIDHLSGIETHSMLTVPLQYYDYDSKSQVLVGVLQLVNKRRGVFNNDDVELVEAFGGHAASVLSKARLYEKLRREYQGTVASLAEAVDAKDRYTHGHSLRVSAYSSALGRFINLAPDRLFNLRVSALLHDIGKIGIPDRILHKRKSLTEKEFNRIKTHVSEGVRILRPANMHREIYEGIFYHHEKWNGKGYSENRKGEDIPLFGRIVAFADAFDTITTKRTYKPAFTFDEGRAIVRKDAGSHFDPELAKIFCDLPLEDVAKEGADIFQPLAAM